MKNIKENKYKFINVIDWNNEKLLESFHKVFPQIRGLQTPIKHIKDFGKKIYIFDQKMWGEEFKGILLNNLFNKEEITECFNFAFDSKDFHKRKINGGSIIRRDIETFFNIFIGKLNEYAVIKTLNQNNININNHKPDFDIKGKGDWDDCDIIYDNNKYISVKGSKYTSQMMLLESESWNKEGRLKYNVNIDSKVDKYDHHAFCRVAGIKDGKISYDAFLLKESTKKYYYENLEKQRSILFNKIINYEWYYDEVYFMNDSLFVKIINDVDMYSKELKYHLNKNTYIFIDKNSKNHLEGVLFKLGNKNPNKENYIESLFDTKTTKFKLDASNFYFPIAYLYTIEDYLKYKIL